MYGLPRRQTLRCLTFLTAEPTGLTVDLDTRTLTGVATGSPAAAVIASAGSDGVQVGSELQAVQGQPLCGLRQSDLAALWSAASCARPLSLTFVDC